ncbi:MAG: ABC transporter ATP-binding protein [Salinisphaera sp.]|uniref:ABC transporter ATP-binding protein n=1 Tax=Salinisphaera sp. TaxID=1914330 RepID=UPI003C7A5C0A
MTQDADGTIELVELGKRFGSHTAVDHINMRIPGGEFFSMLGPSGCGKTTTLRMIAGFERPDAGRIVLNGEDMAQCPPHKRSVNTVFQSYALFPHLNVFDNVAFGLRRRKLGRAEVARRTEEALELVMLGGMGKRKPSQLSGGQQQRVALARALVLRPSGLLLDEPLGALDAKLRKQLQIELKALQEQVGITFIYVTHDQNEALTMSDRIAVMKDGRIEQVGPPQQIYEAPETVFVADFLGASNLMDAIARGNDGHGRCRIEIGGRTLAAGLGNADVTGAGKATIRPERIRLDRVETVHDGENRLEGRVERSMYLGNAFLLIVKLDVGCTIEVEIQNTGERETAFAIGDKVSAYLAPDALRVLPEKAAAETGRRAPTGQAKQRESEPGRHTDASAERRGAKAAGHVGA